MYYLRITQYAEELLAALDRLPEWPDRVRTMQANWIGRSEGVNLCLPLRHRRAAGQSLRSSRRAPTRSWASPSSRSRPSIRSPSSRRGATRKCAHSSTSAAAAASWKPTSRRWKRRASRPGSVVRHPLTGADVPVWVGNYVLMAYGEGAVMGVPGHDERDFAFAKKYGLPIVPVIDVGGQPYSTERLAGLVRRVRPLRAIPAPTTASTTRRRSTRSRATSRRSGLGRKQVVWRLRDWGISRQRYWGCPIPIIHCPACGDVPVPDDAVAGAPARGPRARTAPATRSRSPARSSTCRCPKCGAAARRETDTMDTFVDSSWYFFRYRLGRATTRAMVDDAREVLDAGRPVHRRHRARDPAPAVLALLDARHARLRADGRRRAVPAAADAGHGPERDLVPQARHGTHRLLQPRRRGGGRRG